MASIRLILGVLLLVAITLPAACAPKAPAVKPAKIRLGVIPSVDPLPLWVAQRDGAFNKAGLHVAIYEFPSAKDRDRALVDGTIDGVEGDLIEIASERSRGVRLRAVTIMNGPSPPYRHSGLVVPPGSKITSLKQLVGVPIATSNGTLQDYVLDTLMSQIGVPDNRVNELAIAKVSVRFESLMAGRVRAAMLGEPYLSLAIQQGARLIADDSKGPNLSQEVLDFREDYLDRPEGAVAVEKLLEVWNEEVSKINANPHAYRELLIEKASVPKPLGKTFQLNRYPTHQLPRPRDVDPLLRWMRVEHLLTKPVTYSDLVWSPPPAR